MAKKNDVIFLEYDNDIYLIFTATVVDYIIISHTIAAFYIY